MSTRNFLFLGGLARSGTSSLWRVFAPSPEAVIGLERYVVLARRPAEFLPELFEEARFFDLRPGDTFYPSLDGPPFGAAKLGARLSGGKGDWRQDPLAASLVPDDPGEIPGRENHLDRSQHL